jgi:PAS domain S-box-containing protein
MRFDAKSLHFRVLVPSLTVIAAVFSLLLFITSCPADTSHGLTVHALTHNGLLSLAALATLGCLLMAGGILLVFRHTIQQPVRLMVTSVAAGERVPATGLSEFDFLANAFNDALQRERQSQDRLHTFLSNAPVILYALDRNGIFTMSEGKGLARLGLSSGQVVGQSALEVYRDYPLIAAGVRRALAGETFTIENAVGEKVFETWYCPMWNERGEFSGTVGVATDISDRKAAEAEKELLTEQLLQSQKMESVGRLAGGVAHDFNNLLTPIIGYTEMLGVELAGTRAGSKLENILKAALRAKQLVQQLLSFSRKQVLEMKVVDINQVVAGFQGILRQTIRESIEIRVKLSQQRLTVCADKHQLEQVIMNLAVNAQDAIEGHGCISIETSPVLIDEKLAEQHPDLSPGPYLLLSFSDDGCGMDRETQSRVFEPFFTTKSEGKGTGLGLATVFGIVRQHGGSVQVSSQTGHGSRFACYFPLVPQAASCEEQLSTEPCQLAGARRCILLVEDNEMVRNLVQELLTQRGFLVLAADEPLQALELSKQCGIDLLVTDVVMPNMTGPKLHARLLESHPGLKVLYMSGYTGDAIPHREELEPEAIVLQKPFGITEFANRVQALLS